MNKTPVPSRIYFFLILMTTVGALIVFQMVRVQLNQRSLDLTNKFIKDFEQVKVTVKPERGKIFDRYGHILATNKPIYVLNINPVAVTNPKTIAETLRDIAGMDYNEVFKAADTIPDPQNGPWYIPLRQRVESDVIVKIQQRKQELLNSPPPSSRIPFIGKKEPVPSLDGLEWQVEWWRIYPEKNLASNILGFVPYMQPEIAPNSGVEGFYNREMSGIPKDFIVPYDPNKITEIPSVPPGDDLILTIDREIQSEMEKIIDEATKNNQADSGTIVVLDPKTGEILAMATSPRIDPNQYWKLDEILPPPTRYNRAISQAIEPGSVFKILTMSIALDVGAVTPTTPFVDTGTIEVGGVSIHDWDRNAWGLQDMTSCMEHSLNVCLAWVATQIGSQRFYPYLKEFGVGRRSRVDMEGEEFDPLKIPGIEVTEANLGTNSFGQGVAVTPLQFISAASALANNGVIMAPHIVKAIVSNGHQRNIEPVVVSKPISAKTAETITAMLAKTVEGESYSRVQVNDIRIAGKTGTAEIAIPGKGYVTNLTNASFIGWGPVDEPKFIMYVWLEKPRTSIWGSMVAAPIFSDATNRLVEIMGMPPDSVRSQLYTQ